MTTTIEAPGPPGHFLLGNATALKTDMLGSIAAWTREYGDVVRLKLGPVPAILFVHHEHLEQLLLSKASSFGPSRLIAGIGKMVFGSGLVTSKGNLWLRRRRMAAPAFTPKRVEAYSKIMSDAVERHLDRWKDGDTRLLQVDTMHLSLEVVARALFGASVEQAETEVTDAVGLLLKGYSKRIKGGLPIPDWVPLPATLEMKRGVRKLEKIVYEIVEQRRAGQNDESDFLGMLLAARDVEDGKGLDDDAIRDEVITAVIGGQESTALGMGWSIYMLGQHRDVQDRVRAEVLEVIGSRRPTSADIMKLKYLPAVLHEVLRLYPPFYTIARDTLEDCQIGDYRVRKGTLVFISPWATHRRVEYFPDPEAFKPDRWLGTLMKDLPKCAYIPFGGGGHICIGNSFALTETMLLIARLVQRFEVEPDPSYKLEMDPGFSLRAKGGLQVIVRERKTA